MEPTYGTPDGLPADDLRARAVERLERKRAFWRQFTTYLMVNGLLWVIWLWSAVAGGSWFPWPIFPMFGWGIGLAFSARATFSSDSYSEDQVQREMRRLGGS